MEEIETSNVVVPIRRPVRKKPKPKYDDFEYDLSNLLKMEAQGYKDSLLTTRVTQKKKPQSDPPSPSNESTKDCGGALLLLSKRAVEKAQAHLRQIKSFSSSSPRNQRSLSIFVKPSMPKLQPLKDSINMSPVKEVCEDKETKKNKSREENDTNDKNSKEDKDPSGDIVKENHIENNDVEKAKTCIEINETSDIKTIHENKNEKVTEVVGTNGPRKEKTATGNIKTNLPIKVPRKSLEVIKNPIINKSFSKAGLLSKVVVLKPRISCKSDGDGQTIHAKPITLKALKTPLKSETLKVVKISKPSLRIDKPNIADKNTDNSDNKSILSINAKTPEVVGSSNITSTPPND